MLSNYCINKPLYITMYKAHKNYKTTAQYVCILVILFNHLHTSFCNKLNNFWYTLGIVVLIFVKVSVQYIDKVKPVLYYKYSACTTLSNKHNIYLTHTFSYHRFFCLYVEMCVDIIISIKTLHYLQYAIKCDI